MPTQNPSPALLRARARALRRLGAALADGEAARLHRRAGPEVWTGPAAASCHQELLLVRRRLLDARDDLERRAIRLEREADRLEGPPAVT